MLITKRSSLTGKIHTMDLPVTQQSCRAYADGALVQDAFPNLTKEQREFIISGITPQEWAMMVGEVGDRDEDEEGELS